MKSAILTTWPGCVRTLILLLPVLLWACATPADAQLRLQPIFDDPAFAAAFVTHAGDGSNRLFIGGRSGRVLVLQPGATTATTFLDISPELSLANEQGLRSLAFHPDYAQNRRFFVDYTRKSDNATVIAEYAVSASDPDFAEVRGRILLVIPYPGPSGISAKWTGLNSYGGMIAFGPDGCLYISTSDEGSKMAQSADDLHGKILRLDVDGALPYAIPTDNPFAGATPGRDEIYALGFGSPRRFSFDRQSGALWAGDVAQLSPWEEVDLVTRGGNYGWPILEGTHCTTFMPSACGDTKFVAPILEYPHQLSNGSNDYNGWVAGGYAYRGSGGTFSQGAYIFGDFLSGKVFQWRNGRFATLLDTTENILSFGEDEAGELYVVTFGGGVFQLQGDGASVYSARLSEGNAGQRDAEFIVRLHPVPKSPLTLNFATHDITAVAGLDYITAKGQFTVPAGESEAFIRVPIIGDTFSESEESFGLRLSGAGIPLVKPTAGGFILNDDGAPAAPTNDNALVTGQTSPPGQPLVVTSTHSDQNGAGDITFVDLHLSGPLRQLNEGLRCRYDAAANKLYVLDDAGKTWLGGFAPGSANVISNSRGRLDCALTQVTLSANEIKIQWHLALDARMLRTWIHLWLRVEDRGGLFGGFARLRRWVYTDNAPVNMEVLQPDAFTPIETQQRFTAHYGRTTSGAPIRYGYLQVGPSANATDALRCLFDFQTKRFYLRSDDDKTWLGGFAPGSANVISNSQGSLNCAASTYTNNTNSTLLTAIFALVPKAKWVNTTQKLFLLVRDTAGLSDGWDEVGKWNINDGSPLLRNFGEKSSYATPISGTDAVGTFYSSHFDFNDDIRQIYLRVGNSGATGFVCLYDVLKDQYYVRNDEDTAWLSPTGSGVLGNNRVQFPGQRAYEVHSARYWNIEWSLQALSPLFNSRQPVFVKANDAAGHSTGWTPVGHWNIGE